MVGYVRRNFLVPVPSFQSFDALNAHLEQKCLGRMDARLRGHDETIGPANGAGPGSPAAPAPPCPMTPCDKQASRVSSLSLVRYRTNDYSAPVAYGHRDVLVKGYVAEVVISCGAEVIARHPRSYEKDDFVFDPIHYLPLLERKTAGPGPGRAPAGVGFTRRVPDAAPPFGVQDGEGGASGEFVQVLRLLETFSHQEVHHAGAGRPPAGRHQLRCREAPAAVPTGRQAAQAGYGPLSLPAPGQREDHQRHGLHGPAVGKGGMSNRSTLLLEHHLKELRLPHLPQGIPQAGRPVRRRGH